MTKLFDRLFHRKSPDKSTKPELEDTSDLNENLEEIVDAFHHGQNAVISPTPNIDIEIPQLVVGIAQSVGVQRDHNEDSLLALTTNLVTDEKMINFGLYIIADGMGGHDDGELASRLAVANLASHVINSLYKPLLASYENGPEISIQEVMHQGVIQAHQLVKKETEGGGTTLTAALILGGHTTITHVGDSRAYIINPDSTMQLLTQDHSLVNRLVEIGKISPEQALIHPQRNVLYRALGQGEPFDPDVFSFQVCPGCQLLLCSDGLWGVIPDTELIHIVTSSLEPQSACQSLIDAANEAGGPDNISAIIIRFPN